VSGERKWRDAHVGGDEEFQIAIVPVSDGTDADVDVAVATEQGIVLLRGDTGKPREFGTSGLPGRMGQETMWGVSAGLLSDGRSFVVGGAASGVVRRWSAETGDPIGVPMLGHGTSVKSMDVVHQQGRPAIILSGDESGVVHRWNADTGERIGPPVRMEPGVEMIGVAVTPEHSPFFACADYRSNVTVWDSQTGRRIGGAVSAGAYPTGLALFESGNSLQVVVANDDATVSRWDVTSGKKLGELPSGYSVSGGSIGSNIPAVAVGTVGGDICIIPMRWLDQIKGVP
jgi:WD40 repeat protein